MLWRLTKQAYRRAPLGEPVGCTRSSAGLGHVVDDCLNVMAIRIEDERCIVILAVVWAQPGGAVVLPAMSERGLVEARDGLAIRGGEGDVGARTRRYCIGRSLIANLSPPPG